MAIPIRGMWLQRPLILIRSQGVHGMTKSKLEITHFSTEYESDKIPAEVLRVLWVTYGVGEYNQGRIELYQYDPSDHTGDGFEKVILTTMQIKIKIPACEVDIKSKMLKLLEAQREKVLADNHMRLKDVEDRIAMLLAIEYQPEA
jgi:hypothetical protein